MTKILLSGCSGTMGSVVVKAAKGSNDISIISGYDIRRNSELAFPVYSDFNEFKEMPDVILDFSNPEALEAVLSFAVKKNIPAVIATTGLSEKEHSLLKSASKSLPVFVSPNMSIGINLLISLVKSAAKVLGEDFDIEIIEKHHNKKLDAPSGTALYIADSINETTGGNKKYIYDRHSQRKIREKSEIGIHSVRGGTIAGEHTVLFAGNDEILEINHTAGSKSIFAAGALKACAYLKGKPPGLYGMQDMLQ
jgi:4-hydroxy-tetrahydrodipicolinate reductase